MDLGSTISDSPETQAFSHVLTIAVWCTTRISERRCFTGSMHHRGAFNQRW